MSNGRIVHPYIPNSVPQIKRTLLEEVGARDVDELYRKMIPRRLLMNGLMKLPKPFPAEQDLKRHVEEILLNDKTCGEFLSFLGAGCWQHFVPEVCDTITSRSELLTSYAGSYYADAGRYQILFEFQSLLGELVDMDVSCLPTYDWGAAAGNSVRMASRITGRKEALISKTISPARLSIISNYCDSVDEARRIEIKLIDFNIEEGTVDIEDLKSKISTKTAGVYFENPSYLGVIEEGSREIVELAHEYGAEVIAGVDPSSLGVLSPPGEYGADICCGEAQPLGIHMFAGGGTCGFIASRDEEKYVGEYPGILTGISSTSVDGEYGFGSCVFERTSYMMRENAKDWVGTCTSLWAVAVAVYLSLMGPQGMRDLGETIIKRSHYAAGLLKEIEGVEVPYGSFFKEFPVRFKAPGRSVSHINRELLRRGIFGGKDISSEFPELEQCGLYCVTEVHSRDDLRRLAWAVREVLE